MSNEEVSVVADGEQEEEVLYAPEEKFANPRDHMGRTALDVKTLCDKTSECKCPICDHKLLVRAGEQIATHFAHAKGRKDTSCKGGFETPWHKCAKLAAGMREGWLHEFTDKTDRHSRFDAYNQFTHEAFEAVHSLSGTYVDKQRSLAGLGISCQWLFDSAGDFANRNPLPLDIDKATSGLLECHDILGKKALEIIQEIGVEHCFLHYLGLAWKWVGIDRWQACSPVSHMQRLCTGERGLNRLLIDLRARGDMPKEKLAFRNGDLVSTAWQEISQQNLLATVNENKEQLLESWRRIKRNRQHSSRKKGSRQYRPSTENDIACRSKPVCELIAERAALTEILNLYLPSIAASGATECPDEGSGDAVDRSHRHGDERPQQPMSDGSTEQCECGSVGFVVRSEGMILWHQCASCGKSVGGSWIAKRLPAAAKLTRAAQA